MEFQALQQGYLFRVMIANESPVTAYCCHCISADYLPPGLGLKPCHFPLGRHCRHLVGLCSPLAAPRNTRPFELLRSMENKLFPSSLSLQSIHKRLCRLCIELNAWCQHTGANKRVRQALHGFLSGSRGGNHGRV